VAYVRAECPLGGKYPDVVVALRGVVVVIEVKVWDTEHGIRWKDDSGHLHVSEQCEAYRRMMGQRRLRSEALLNLGPEALALVGDRPDIASFFIRPWGREASKDESTVDITWMNIERDVAQAVKRRRPGVEADRFLRAFRSNLLLNTGATPPPVMALESLRNLVDLPALRRSDPLGAYLRLRSALSMLGGYSDDE